MNGTIITKAELKNAIEAQRKVISYRQRDNPAQAEAELKDLNRKALDSLIDRELVLKEFTKMGGTIKPKYIDEDIDSIVREQFKGDAEAFISSLAKEGLTLKKFRENRERMIIVQVMRSKQGGKPAAPSAAEIEAYYKKNMARWEALKVRISTITISKKSTEENAAPGQQRQKAEEIRAQIAGGADFATLARKYSQDSHAEKGGDWGWMEMSQLSPVVREIVRKTDAGEMSAVTGDAQAYLIIAVHEKKPSETPSVDSLRPEIEKLIKAERAAEQVEKWLSALRSKAVIRRNA